MLHPDTRAAVMSAGIPYRFVDIQAGDEGAYGRLVRRLWSEGSTFIICEHDVVPTFNQLQQMASCGHSWCCYRYNDSLYPDGPMFGLVRFAGHLLKRHPMAAECALVVGKRRDQEAPWWSVDSLIARDLMIRMGQSSYTFHPGRVHHAHVGAPSGPCTAAG
jgi:hypothetical protein